MHIYYDMIWVGGDTYSRVKNRQVYWLKDFWYTWKLNLSLYKVHCKCVNGIMVVLLQESCLVVSVANCQWPSLSWAAQWLSFWTSQQVAWTLIPGASPGISFASTKSTLLLFWRRTRWRWAGQPQFICWYHIWDFRVSLFMYVISLNLSCCWLWQAPFAIICLQYVFCMKNLHGKIITWCIPIITQGGQITNYVSVVFGARSLSWFWLKESLCLLSIFFCFHMSPFPR